MKFQKHLLLLLTLLILTSQVRANNTEISNKDKSKHFVSFGIGINKNNATLEGYESEKLDNSSAYSIEFGSFLREKNNLKFAASFEISRSETETKYDEYSYSVRIPTLGANLYVAYTDDERFTPYLGIGLIYNLYNSVKLKISENDESMILSNNKTKIGYQIKLGNQFNIKDKFGIGIEYKYSYMPTDLDMVKMNGIEIKLDEPLLKAESNIHSLLLKLTKEF